MMIMPLITPAKIDTRIHPYSIAEGRVHSLRRGGEVDHTWSFSKPPKFSPEEIIKTLEHFFGKKGH
jgi:hypothetical protein